MIRLPLCLAVALALLASACGGGDGNGNGASSPSGEPAQTSSAPAPTQTPSAETPPGSPAGTNAVATTYVVKPGDSVYSIAVKFGTSVQAIVQANNLNDPAKIWPGVSLIIPGPLYTFAPTVAATPAPAAANVIRKGNPTRKTVALTFDAGSDAGYTVPILDTLKANGIHVSFGMTGVWSEHNPDLLKRIVGEGHHLINHSYDHFSFTGSSTKKPPLTQAQRWEEVDKTESIIQGLTGTTTLPYFRPPFGDYDDSVNADVAAHGYQYSIMWSVDSRGWTGIPVPQITQNVLGGVEPGAIVVMHVGASSQDGLALPGIIDGLRAAGYSIGSVPDVLAP